LPWSGSRPLLNADRWRSVTAFPSVPSHRQTSFPLMAKVDVNGDDAAPLFKWLKHEKAGMLGMERVQWNFSKWLLDREGKVVGRFAPTTSPSSIAADIEKLL
jgi:glutathione peroxidase